MKRPSSKARGKSKHPFENKKVDFAKFKSHPPVTEIAKLTRPGVGTTMPSGVPIETLSASKTVGLGNVWLELGNPLGVFPHHDPPLVSYWEWGDVKVWFDPKAYGITSVATYVITFNIDTFNGGARFRLVWPGWGQNNPRTITVNGPTTVQLIVPGLHPGGLASASLKWLSGARDWAWYSSTIKFPDIVVGPQ